MIKWLDKLVSIVLHLLIPEFPGIPTNFFLFYDSRNSGITTYIGLFTNNQSWLSIEFRYGIPGNIRTRNRSGIGRNSYRFPEFRKHVPIVLHLLIPEFRAESDDRMVR
jgi:hypothetical protein